MTDALVSPILELLLKIAAQQVQEEVNLVGVEKQVDKLRSNLIDIQSVLEDAERKQVKVKAVRVWLDKLKDVQEEVNLVVGVEKQVDKLKSNLIDIQSVIEDAERKQVKDKAVRVWLDKLKDGFDVVILPSRSKQLVKNWMRLPKRKELPRAIAKLIKLRHLCIYDSGVAFMPKGIERLTCLRTLDCFMVYGGGENESKAANLRELKNLDHIGRLVIENLQGGDIEDAAEAQLKNKKRLLCLDLNFCKEHEIRLGGIEDSNLIEVLQLPPDLERLSIRWYGGIVLPNWMMALTRLQELRLVGCGNLQVLPSLVRLPNLESLVLQDMGVKRLDAGFLGIEEVENANINEGEIARVTAFPKLETLVILRLNELEEWDGIERRVGEEDATTTSIFIIMPRLQQLSIRQCPLGVRPFGVSLLVSGFDDKAMYGFELYKATDHELPRLSSNSLVDDSSMCGRDDEKKSVVSMLLAGSSQEARNVDVISLVGLGGIGKTTLAQLAFNDAKVTDHFEKKIWVCVSEPFDEVRITKAILEQLEGSTSNLDDLQSLLQRVSQSINGIRVLLVLDDVWTEDHRHWEQLKPSLAGCARGSKILVTTRKGVVATMMGTDHRINIETLSDDACRSIFNHVAFHERSNDERERLTDIGNKIASKCKGLPLAAKVLGGLMQSKRTREEWEDVLSSELWRLDEVDKDQRALSSKI
uniref:NB-ARC domain-containing protein n=1 Tax=Salix viminalis TaxID=40686 RepID=A0A6N2LNX5_SALVM